MATKVEYSATGLRLKFDVSAQPTPRVQQVYPIPDLPVQSLQYLSVALETIAESGRKGIRVTSLDSFPGTATAVYSIIHTVTQGGVTATDEIPVGNTVNLLLDQPIPSATHTFALKRVDAGQVTTWPSTAISTPADSTYQQLMEILSDGIITPNEKLAVNLSYTDAKNQYIATLAGARAQGQNSTKLTTAWTALDSYIQGLTYFFDLTKPTDINPTTWKTLWDAFSGAVAEVRAGLTGVPKANVVARVNVNLSSPPTSLDSYTIQANDLVCVITQTVPGENGLYLATTGTWTKAADLFHGENVDIKSGYYAGDTIVLDRPVANGAITVGAVAMTTTVGQTANWGNITGTLSGQTDLQAALDAKASLSGATFNGVVAVNSTLVVPFTVGAGGTAASSTYLKVNGTSAAGQGSGVMLARNGTNSVYFGDQGGGLGGSNAFGALVYVYQSGSLSVWTGGSQSMLLDSAGALTVRAGATFGGNVGLGAYGLTAGGLTNTGAVTTLGANGNGALALYLNSATGTNRDITWQTAGLGRWVMRVSGAESGSNTGGDFQLISRDDTGAAIDWVMQIPRAAGSAITLGRPISGPAATFTGVVTATRVTLTSGGGYVAGTIYRAPAAGTVLAGVTGSSYDFGLVSGGGNFVLVNPTGTDQVSLPVNIGSTSTTTGSLVVAGGVGIGGAVNLTNFALGDVSGRLRLSTNGSAFSMLSATNGYAALNVGVTTVYGALAVGHPTAGAQQVYLPVDMGASSIRAQVGGAHKWGLSFSSTGLSIYDWANTRSVFNYDPTANTISFGPPASFAGAILLNGNTGQVAGSVAYSTVNGLQLWGKTGSTNDLALVSAAGNVVAVVPTGTGNMDFYGSVSIKSTAASTYPWMVKNSGGARIASVYDSVGTGIMELLNASYVVGVKLDGGTGTGTFTGAVTVNSGGGTSKPLDIGSTSGTQSWLRMISASGSTRKIDSLSGSTTRWSLVLGDATAESGSNAGSNFALQAFDDAGASLSTPLSIARSTGAATFSGTVAAPSYKLGTANIASSIGAINYLWAGASGLNLVDSSGNTVWLGFGSTGAATFNSSVSAANFYTKAAASNSAFMALATGDAAYRISIAHDGGIYWADGTNGWDTKIARTGSAMLGITGGASFSGTVTAPMVQLNQPVGNDLLRFQESGVNKWVAYAPTTGKLAFYSSVTSKDILSLDPTGAGYLNGSQILTTATLGSNASTIQAATASATAPMVGTAAQRDAYVVPAGATPYWYATDVLAADGQYGRLYQWSGSAWVDKGTPATVTGRVTAGVISAGSIGAQAIAADVALVNQILRNTGHSPGTSSTAPQGFKIKADGFTATYLDGTSETVVAEFGGNISIGGLKAAVIANRTKGGLYQWSTPGTYTWTAPEGIFEIELTLQAGGGGGAAGVTNSGGGGGGGGGMAMRGMVQVVPGTVYTIVVGAGGTAGTTSGAAGGNGGNSSMSGSGFTTRTVFGGGGGTSDGGSSGPAYESGVNASGLTFSTGWEDTKSIGNAPGGGGGAKGLASNGAGNGGSATGYPGGYGGNSSNSYGSGGGGGASVYGKGGDGGDYGAGQAGGVGGGGGGGGCAISAFYVGGTGGPGYARIRF